MKVSEIYMYVLGTLVVLGCFGITIYLIYSGKYPDAFMLIIGALIGAFSTVVGYFFGSSKGSSSKDETISDFVNKK
jgi:hypothetical protein